MPDETHNPCPGGHSAIKETASYKGQRLFLNVLCIATKPDEINRPDDKASSAPEMSRTLHSGNTCCRKTCLASLAEIIPVGSLKRSRRRRLFSSVVEHWSRKPGVVSSILTGGKWIFVVEIPSPSSIAVISMSMISKREIVWIFLLFFLQNTFQSIGFLFHFSKFKTWAFYNVDWCLIVFVV